MSAPAKKVGRPGKSAKAAVKAPAPAPAKAVKRSRKRALTPERPGYTRRSKLWAELKRLAAEEAAKLSYTQVSTEQLEPMVEEVKKGKQNPSIGMRYSVRGVRRWMPPKHD